MEQQQTAAGHQVAAAFALAVMRVFQHFELDAHERYFRVNPERVPDFEQRAKASLTAFFKDVLVLFEQFEREHTEFPECLKYYEPRDQHNPTGIFNFEGYHFYFPLRWHELCPAALLAVPTRFHACSFHEGFFFADSKGAGSFYFDALEGPSRLDFDSVVMYRLRIRGEVDVCLLQDVVVKRSLYFEDAKIRKALCLHYVNIQNFFIFHRSQLTGVFWLMHCEFHACSITGQNTYFMPRGVPEFHDDPLKKQLDILGKWPLTGDGVVLDDCKVLTDTDFTGTIFRAPVLLRKVEFEGEAHFNGCAFKDRTIFDRVTFVTSPKFHGVKIYHDTSFFNPDFQDFKSLDATGDYKTLKHLMLGINAESEANRFRAYEQKARNRHLKFGLDPVGKTSATVFEMVSDYHQDLLKPLLWLVVFSLAMTAVYWLMDGVYCLPQKTIVTNNYWLLDFCHNGYWRSFVFALHQTIWPLGILTQNDIWDIQTPLTKVVTYLHFIGASVVWFLLISGIRKRFML